MGRKTKAKAAKKKNEKAKAAKAAAGEFFIERVCAAGRGTFRREVKFGRGRSWHFVPGPDGRAFFVVFGANALVFGRSGGARDESTIQFALVSLVIAMHLHSSAFLLFS